MGCSAVFFDLDGTLLNTLGDLTSAVNFVLEGMGYPTRTAEEVRSFIGDGFAMLIKRACPDGTADFDTDKAYKMFAAYYSAHLKDTTVPYDGIPELLSALKAKGYPLAVISNKRDDAVKKLVSDFFGETFSLALGERGGNTRKPSPVLCLEAAEKLCALPESVVYIGDSPSDIQTALNAGMVPVGVTWGFRTEEQLKSAGAKLIARSPKDLYDLITHKN